jgi:hypothetical protein
MKDKKENRHPLFGTNLKNWLRLLSQNKGIDRGFYLRALFVSITLVLFLPARLLFRFIYAPRISKTEIKKPPIFIIGHWRSGTTYLHELISNDPQFAYVTLWYTLVPESYLALKGLKKFFSQFLPTKRPMDQIDVDMDSPYEEEAALAALGTLSFFHCFIFPKNPQRQFKNSVLFEGISKMELECWKESYLNIIKSVSFSNNGKQIIIKNPANTSRIKVLLELFPDACFIFIYRNPYKVYASTSKLRKRVLGPFALQRSNPDELEQNIIDNYISLMDSYFKQKELIAPNGLVEIRYEDLVERPLEQIKYIYSKLDLKGFDKAEPMIKKHIESQAGYKTNVYKFYKEIIDIVDKNWGFYVKKWGYKPPK